MAERHLAQEARASRSQAWRCGRIDVSCCGGGCCCGCRRTLGDLRGCSNSKGHTTRHAPRTHNPSRARRASRRPPPSRPFIDMRRNMKPSHAHVDPAAPIAQERVSRGHLPPPLVRRQAEGSERGQPGPEVSHRQGGRPGKHGRLAHHRMRSIRSRPPRLLQRELHGRGGGPQPGRHSEGATAAAAHAPWPTRQPCRPPATPPHEPLAAAGTATRTHGR